MPPHPHPPLTLVVATTPIRTSESSTRLGIGLNGTLPWPRIKADMSFFARVTTRPPVQGTSNAIIMGRKTYDSLPGTLRPLAKRINVVVTRDTEGVVRERVSRELEAKKAKAATTTTTTTTTKAIPTAEPITDAVVSSSLDAALDTLETQYGSQGKLGKVFVIGGGELYESAIRLGDVGRRLRIIMTNVKLRSGEEFPCDTFFPLDESLAERGWRAASAQEVTDWVGEEVSSEWREEGDVAIQMVGYEKI
ncbi:hypothetical protein ASPZODRAFT_55835 [Penicilliopsis zonata CBS 506.65]|uniref:Dihydrofolate reductase n=1 Tax=Penicilliopsis zonata CBS 506.65 TaxID=1073090 RepID=A0A1L9STN4_9EURO|nr:hypothetical protein ASPZODRAFT_55835 [Penicilliopsis zonata CBS 506.65]OJJ50559.1 hypothetical protein ASPZODRAFT_55835 [Penicilliopsis zonata CBS 506.65]